MSLVEAVREARSGAPRDLEPRLKAVVAAELSRLVGRTAKIRDTEYFNHTAIPDFVVEWHDRSERGVYLRFSMESVSAYQDEAHLGQEQAAILSLKPDVDAWSEGASASDRRLLVTDTATLDLLTDGTSAENAGPLASVVRENFVRGARGRVGTRKAQELLSPEGSTVSEARVRESFVEDAAFRILRTSSLISWALGIVDGPQVDGMTGRLSEQEVQSLVPWALEHQNKIAAAFWHQLGSLMTFQELEELDRNGYLSSSVDVSPLVSACADVWVGNRAVASEPLHPLDGTAEAGRWSFANGHALGVDTAHQRLQIAHDRRKLRERPGSSFATWDEVSQVLGGHTVVAASLQGVQRRVDIAAEQATHVRQDIEDLTSSLTDRYFVNSVTVRLPGRRLDEAATDVVVNFEDRIVEPSQSESVSLRDLAHLTLGVLEYRRPLDSNEIDALFLPRKNVD